MGINLRCGKARMAQNLLYRIYFRTIVKHVGGEGMAQYVWTFLIYRSNHGEVFFYHRLDLFSTDLLARLVKEKVFGIFEKVIAFLQFQIFCD